MQERQIGKISEENTDVKHIGMTKESKVISSELQKGRLERHTKNGDNFHLGRHKLVTSVP